jgi:hypothetical protein
MAAARCTCGFAEVTGGDYPIGDHLFEAFVPDDGRAPDGLVHLQGEADFYCMCGIGGSAEKLDAHLLEIFTPPDSIGRDGTEHRMAGPRG